MGLMRFRRRKLPKSEQSLPSRNLEHRGAARRGPLLLRRDHAPRGFQQDNYAPRLPLVTKVIAAQCIAPHCGAEVLGNFLWWILLAYYKKIVVVGRSPSRWVAGKGRQMTGQTEREGLLRTFRRWLRQWVSIRGGFVIEGPKIRIEVGSPSPAPACLPLPPPCAPRSRKKTVA